MSINNKNLFFAEWITEKVSRLETIDEEDVKLLISKCKELGLDSKKMVISSPDFYDFDKKFDCIFIYDPRVYLDTTKKFQIIDIDKLEKHVPIKMFGTFFGNLMSGNKIILFKKIFDENILENCIWTAYNFHKINDNLNNQIQTQNFINFCQNETPKVFLIDKFYKKNPIDFDQLKKNKTITDDHINIYDLNNYDLSLYENSMISVVVDSNASNKNTRHTTSKTFKPIKFKRPFITTFGKNSLQYLKKLGFKTFSDCWDENYDKYCPTENQFDMIVNSMKEIIQTSTIDEIFKQTKINCEYNYNLLMDTDWNKWYLNQLEK